MAYYYVKSGGTKTTGSTTKQTGSFATLGVANYYDNVAAAFTGGATSGDFICVSNAHAYTSGASINWAGPSSGDYVYVVCVDDANCDTYVKATTELEYHNSPLYLGLNGRISLHGFYLKSNNDIRFNDTNSQLLAYESTFHVTGSTDIVLQVQGDGQYFKFTSCEFIGVSGTDTKVQTGSHVNFIDCTFTGITDLWTNLMGGNGGCTVEMIGCDLSSITGSLWKDGGNTSTADDGMVFRYIGCKLNATEPVFVTETLENMHHRILVSNCSGDSVAAEYQHYEAGYGGQVEDNTTIYRAESLAYPSGEQVSWKCDTNANASKAAPFWFDMPSRFANLANTNTDVVTIHLAVANTTTLYDSDVWVELVYPDATNKNTYNYKTTRHTDIMDTNGTALTTDSGSDWRNGASALTGYNEYKIDVDTSTVGNGGGECVPIMRVHVAVPSEIIYFCITPSLS